MRQLQLTLLSLTEDVAGTADAAVDLEAADHASVTPAAVLGVDAGAYASASRAADATITTAVYVTDDNAGPADAVINLAQPSCQES